MKSLPLIDSSLHDKSINYKSFTMAKTIFSDLDNIIDMKINYKSRRQRNKNASIVETCSKIILFLFSSCVRMIIIDCYLVI